MATLGRFFQEPDRSFFLFGPRGTGKTTWLRQRFPAALWLDLLDPELARRLLARPRLLEDMLAAHRGSDLVVIDEVQRVPELLSLVHQLIEARRARFVLTGSSARKLNRAGVDLLAGRALLRHMHPFMAAELPEFRLEQALHTGLLPLVWDSPVPHDTLRSYASLYLREEVQQEGLVRNVGQFARFLEAISFSHGSTLNLAAVARECGQVSRKTVEGYLDILEDLLLAFRLPVFSRRAQRKLAAHPKFYFFDAGVFQSLRPRGPLDSAAEAAGPALEGLVAQHLRAWIDLSNQDDSLHYWRTQAGNEVDFVLYGPSGFHALEIKLSGSLQPADFSGLRSFGEDYPEAELLLLYGGAERLRRGRVLCLPVGPFLAEIRPGAPLPT